MRFWDKELCREFGRLAKNRKSRVYYVNKYKYLARLERDRSAPVSLG